MTDAAAVQRQGRVRGLVSLPFLIGGVALGIWLNVAARDTLAETLYTPTCAATCSDLGGRAVSHRVGGRGHLGELRCECDGVEPRWHRGELSRATPIELALHWGGQEVLAIGGFAALALLGLALGERVARRPTG